MCIYIYITDMILTSCFTWSAYAACICEASSYFLLAQDFSSFISSFGGFAMLHAVGLHVLRYSPDRSIYIFAPTPGVQDSPLRAQVALEKLSQQLSLPEPKAGSLWEVI